MIATCTALMLALGWPVVVPQARAGEPHAVCVDAPALEGKPRWEPRKKHHALYNTAVHYVHIAQFDEAEVRLRRLLDMQPGCGLAVSLLGRTLSHQQRQDEALPLLHAAACAFPEEADAWQELGWTAFRVEDLELARQAAEVRLALEPDSLNGLSLAVSVPLREGAHQAASELLHEYGAPHGEADLDCMRLKIALEAQQEVALDRLWASCQQSEARWLVDEAKLKVGQERGDFAMIAQAAQALGDSWKASAARARGSLAAGDYEAACPVLEDLWRKRPEALDTRLLVADCQVERGELLAACDTLRGVCNQQTWTHLTEGGALSGVLTLSSEKSFRRMVEEGSGLLVWTLARNGQTEEAEERLDEARAALGEVPAMVAATALLRGAQGRWCEVPAQLDAALEHRGSFLPQALQALADTCPAGEDCCEAIRARMQGGGQP